MGTGTRLMTDAERIEWLLAENERLRDEIAVLKQSFSLPALYPLEWKLTPTEARVLGCLATRGMMTFDMMMTAIYSDRVDQPLLKILHVWVYKLRRKLKPFDIAIQSIWGVGYSVSPETRARLTEKRAA